MSFLSLLQNMGSSISPSLIQYVWSLPILNCWWCYRWMLEATMWAQRPCRSIWQSSWSWCREIGQLWQARPPNCVDGFLQVMLMGRWRLLIWTVTGVSPDRYELVLCSCVDADTKVFPDSLWRMVNYMVDNEQIMSLRRKKDCKQSGNLRDDDARWVMLLNHLALEYSTFHHMTKTFEFGGVTWLFQYVSDRRTKGQSYYWVPILTMWMVNLRILSMPLTRKISSFSLPSWWRLISHYSHKQHFPTVRMSSSSLQNYLSWYLPRNPSQ